MQQQVRQLTLVIEPTGSTTDRIEHIEGYLSGVAGTLDFSAGIYATPTNVELQFAKITSGANAGKYAAPVRLLGIAGGQQKLNAIICFTGGSPEALNLTSDLTTELAAFNADKRESSGDAYRSRLLRHHYRLDTGQRRGRRRRLGGNGNEQLNELSTLHSPPPGRRSTRRGRW